MELSALVSYLAQDKLDLIVISKHMLPLMEGLDIGWKTIIPSRLCIYVHQSNPLYDREYLDFSAYSDMGRNSSRCTAVKDHFRL